MNTEPIQQTINDIRDIFIRCGFKEIKTWGDLLMENDSGVRLFVKNGFITLSRYEGKGNGTTGFLHKSINHITKDQLYSAVKQSEIT